MNEKASCQSCWYDEFAIKSTTTESHKMQLETILNHVTHYKPFVIASAEFSEDEEPDSDNQNCFTNIGCQRLSGFDAGGWELVSGHHRQEQSQSQHYHAIKEAGKNILQINTTKLVRH